MDGALFSGRRLRQRREMTYSDAHLRDVLKSTRTVAVVGVSMNPVRPSYYVAR